MAQTKKTVIKGVGNLLVNDFSTGVKQMVLARLQSVGLEFTIDIEDVFGGDAYFPFTTFVTGKGINVTSSTALFDIRILKTLVGGTEDLAAEEEEVWELAEGVVVPSSLEYTLEYGENLVEDSESVYYTETGETLTEAGSTPSEEGEYSIDETGTIEFHSDDEGANISIDYKHTVEADTLALDVDDVPGSFEFLHVAKLQTQDYERTMQTRIYRVTPTGSVSLDFARDSASSAELEFRVLDPGRADNRVAEVKIY